MNLIRPVSRPYIASKEEYEGEEGSGKSTTAAYMNIGTWRALQRDYGLTQPIVHVESEDKFWKNLAPIYLKAKVPVKPEETRSFQRLVQILDECNQNGTNIVSIDTMTHFALDFNMSFAAEGKMWECFKCKGTGEVKGLLCMKCGGLGKVFGDSTPKEMNERNLMWMRNINDRVLGYKYFVRWTGRLQWVFENIEQEYEDEKTGEVKTKIGYVSRGQRAQVGKNLAYEPDVIVKMERIIRKVAKLAPKEEWTDDRGKKHTKKRRPEGAVTAEVTNVGQILKVPPEVPALIRLGVFIPMPNWENLGVHVYNHYQSIRKMVGEMATLTKEMQQTGTALNESKPSRTESAPPSARGESRALILADIEASLDFVYSGTGQEAKEKKAAFLMDAFQTASFEKVAQAWDKYPIDKLRPAQEQLQQLAADKRASMVSGTTVPPAAAPGAAPSAPSRPATPPPPTAAAPSKGAQRVVRKEVA